MLKNTYIFIFIFILFSCKTTTDPIIYSKDTNIIEKEVKLIRILINNDNYEKAKIELDKNQKLYPKSLELKELRGWLLLKEYKLDESEKIFISLLEEKENNPQVYAGLARIYRIKGDYNKAFNYVSKGIAILPTLSILWLEKGIIEYQRKDYKKALVDFNKAYNIENKNLEAYLFKYITMLQLGRELDEVKHHWENIITDRRIKSWFYLYHSDVLYNKDLKDDSFRIIKDGLNKFPEDEFLLNSYAYLLYEKYLEKNDELLLQDAEQSIIKCLENSKNIKPGFIDTYLSILEAKKDNKQLIIIANKYFLVFPDSEIIIKWIKKINK